MSQYTDRDRSASKALSHTLGQIAAFDPGHLVRNDLSESFKLSDHLEDFVRAVELAKIAADLDYTLFTDEYLTHLRTSAQNIHSAMTSISGWKPYSGTDNRKLAQSSSQINDFKSKFRNCYVKFFEHVSPAIAVARHETIAKRLRAVEESTKKELEKLSEVSEGVRTSLGNELANFKASFEKEVREATNLRDSIKGEFDGMKEGMKSNIANVQKDFDKLKTETDDIVTKFRELAKDKGVSAFAIAFSKSKNLHGWLAVGWGVATFLIAVGLVWVGWSAINQPPEILKDLAKPQMRTAQPSTARVGSATSLAPLTQPAASPPVSKQAVSAIAFYAVSVRIFIASVLYFLLVWCAKNYSSNVHNWIVNKHRQLSLETFQAFAESSSSQEVKDQVLLETTKAIFGYQPTGFSKAGEQSGPKALIDNLFTSMKKSGG